MEPFPRYEMPLWRPPSEARSLIVQVTRGCSHNRCTFCEMYKMKRFSVRPLAEAQRDMEEVGRQRGERVRRVFLADGDALVLPTKHLLSLLETAGRSFSGLERVACYATPQNILRKSPEELRRVRDGGLSLLYLGVESGDDRVLEAVKKGVDSEAIVEAGRKAQDAGFTLSTTVMLGIGGPKRSLEHARGTAKVLSRIDPAYASALTVMDPPSHYEGGKSGNSSVDRPWLQMDVWNIISELLELVEGMDMTDCMFRSNHASNYLPLKGTLPKDKQALVRQVKEVLGTKRPGDIRPEWMRGL